MNPTHIESLDPVNFIKHVRVVVIENGNKVDAFRLLEDECGTIYVANFKYDVTGSDKVRFYFIRELPSRPLEIDGVEFNVHGIAKHLVDGNSDTVDARVWELIEDQLQRSSTVDVYSTHRLPLLSDVKDVEMLVAK